MIVPTQGITMVAAAVATTLILEVVTAVMTEVMTVAAMGVPTVAMEGMLMPETGVVAMMVTTATLEVEMASVNVDARPAAAVRRIIPWM